MDMFHSLLGVLLIWRPRPCASLPKPALGGSTAAQKAGTACSCWWLPDRPHSILEWCPKRAANGAFFGKWRSCLGAFLRLEGGQRVFLEGGSRFSRVRPIRKFRPIPETGQNTRQKHPLGSKWDRCPNSFDGSLVDSCFYPKPTKKEVHACSPRIFILESQNPLRHVQVQFEEKVV